MNRFLLQNAKWTGYQDFLGNLRNTGLDLMSSYSQEAPAEVGSSSREKWQTWLKNEYIKDSNKSYMAMTTLPQLERILSEHKVLPKR
jgi:hypothetical protein